MESSQAADEAVLYDVTPSGVATITLNRPDRLNSLTPSGAQRLGDLLSDAEDDDAVRCVLLNGTGRSFCAGGDVDVLKKRDSQDRSKPDSELERYLSLLEVARARHAHVPLRLYRYPKPTVAVVHGHTYGVGLSIALNCDIRVAADDTRFNTMFTRVGRSGDFGVTYTLPRIVGRGKARELLFTSKTIGAEEALSIGLVEEVYPAADTQPEGRSLAEAIAAGPPEAIARMKRNLDLAEEGDLPHLLDQEAELQTLCGHSAEGRECFEKWVNRFRAETGD